MFKTLNLYKQVFVLVILGLLLINCSFNSSAKSNEVFDIQALVNDGAYLVDVRTPEEYMEGHVNGSVNIPLADIENNISKFADRKHIIVFCRSGKRSAEASVILSGHGFENVFDACSWIKVKEDLGQ